MIWEFAKTGYQSAMAVPDRIYRHRIIFHHVPKCGGSSVTTPLRLRSLLSYRKIDEDAVQRVAFCEGHAGYVSRHEEAFRQKRGLVLYEAESGTRLIQSHVPWFPAEASSAAASYDRVTVIRHPVDRFVSHYFFDRKQDNLNTISREIGDFLQTDQARCFATHLTRYFSGRQWPYEVGKEPVEAAIAGIGEFSIVGILEDLPKFKRDILRRYGWSIRIPKTNEGARDRNLPDALMEEIRELCASDLMLYEMISQTRRSTEL
ncbi:sulfotransferase family 2 domain-containing protein [Silicimonas sp. MF1-12-2]|uniref:sulfotransferase family 2 domain-containing protein n=1 Tax=Silicimonas sp. MF1-12-2 TaxID=3384793 RepID=UPI0039B4390E